MINVLIIGYGNIAKKHIKNLKKINSKFNFFIIVQNLKKYKYAKNIKIFDKLKNINLDLFKIVLICSPANTHLRYLNFFLNRHVKIFIEKPLGTNSKLIQFILKKNKEIKADVTIGYVLRKNFLANRVFQIIKKKQLGKIHNVKIKASSFLPTWRKNKDYKKTVSAQKRLGGGVLFELSHEIDYLFWLFGSPKIVKSKLIFNKSLKTDVETGVILNLFFKEGFKAIMELDFHSKNKNIRFCEIKGHQKNLLWDLQKKIIKIENKKTKKIQKILDSGNMFFNQMKYFVNKKFDSSYSKNELSHSLKIIRFIEHAKKKGSL